MDFILERTPISEVVPHGDMPTSAYIHIPFCRRRCYYCDFPISVIGDRKQGEESGTIIQYVDVLCQEIITTPSLGKPLQTIFLGGGTPSLISAQQLERILATLERQFGVCSTVELSMEMDPGTFDLSQIQGYQKAGVNRVSLGAQAFQTNLLAACGRTHTPNDIVMAVDLLRQVGLDNFSLDLISGLPHQTSDDWYASLQQAIALAPPHLSIYDLTIEPGTAFGRWLNPGSHPLPSDDSTAEMYRLAQQILTAAGFNHYEISNYAKPGYQCRHNRVYWQNRSYYGFGMGAASYIHQQRFTRPRKRQDYFQWVQTLIAQQGAIACPVTPPDEILLDTLMVGLRLAEGVSLTRLATEFGDARVTQILQCLHPYQKQGWVRISKHRDTTGERSPNDYLQLTDPEGFLFSNVVLATLFRDLGPD